MIRDQREISTVDIRKLCMYKVSRDCGRLGHICFDSTISHINNLFP
jgi:hypothetical protein